MVGFTVLLWGVHAYISLLCFVWLGFYCGFCVVIGLFFILRYFNIMVDTGEILFFSLGVGWYSGGGSGGD